MKAWSQPWSQAFLAETLETGYKNRDVSQRHASFCDESLEKIDAKDGILSLESVDYFGTNEYVSENKLVRCCKLSLHASGSCD